MKQQEEAEKLRREIEKEKQNQQKLAKMGMCVAGYLWIKMEHGYRYYFICFCAAMGEFCAHPRWQSPNGAPALRVMSCWNFFFVVCFLNSNKHRCAGGSHFVSNAELT